MDASFTSPPFFFLVLFVGADGTRLFLGVALSVVVCLGCDCEGGWLVKNQCNATNQTEKGANKFESNGNVEGTMYI